MIVVSDTTPFITLMKAERLNVLYKLFGEVYVPQAVFDELTRNKAFKEEAEIIKDSDYIKVVKVKDKTQVELLQRATGLDLGESEAIIYADEAFNIIKKANRHISDKLINKALEIIHDE